MINFEINYIKNKKAELLEQAAGFPPFTRGYSAISQPIQIKSNLKSDFRITDYTDESIKQLFSQIISNQTKGQISLNVPFNGTTNEVTYIRVFRTLLSFISAKLYNNASAIQFEFYGEYIKPVASLNCLLFAKAAQLDVLLVNDIENWLPIENLVPQTPVDSFYGSYDLEKETSAIFFGLWKQMHKILP